MDTSDSDTDESTVQRAKRQSFESLGSGRRRLRLLIVEDYEVLRESLRLYFSYLGYIVGVADCFEDAIKEAERNPPDVLICDWNINGRRDGTDVAREIHRRYCATIIFISGAPMAQLREASRDLTGAHYFRKPASPDEVAKIVETVEPSDR